MRLWKHQITKWEKGMLRLYKQSGLPIFIQLWYLLEHLFH